MGDLHEGQRWFESARLGIFVHWGHYSQHGWEPSWPLVGGSAAFPYGQDLRAEEYYRNALSFAPVSGAARDWAKRARRCGAKYMVLTTKHHDGYALFDGPDAGFGVMQSICKRDLVREFVDATRAEGLRVGLYFSLPDWHHPHYPAWRDDMRPYPLVAYPRTTPERWERFLAHMRAQLTHLLTAYGKIDLIWFDGGWERSSAEWDAKGLESLIRHLQPDIVINDRLPDFGDYETPEQSVPPKPPNGPWETCLTMNHSWGNVDADRDWKSAYSVLETLCEVAGAGGNLLLNISPDGAGNIPGWQCERLEAFGEWMARHSEAIHGCERGLEAWQFHGPSTRKANRIFLFCTMRPQEHVVVRGLYGRRIVAARALGTNRRLEIDLRLSPMERIFNVDSICDALIKIPEDAIDALVSVIELELGDGPVR